MANAVVVLVPNTPPDSAKPLAIFIEGATQNHAGALAAAENYKVNYAPTASIQNCTIEKYDTTVVINS